MIFFSFQPESRQMKISVFFQNVPWFLLRFTFIKVRATFERQTKMSQLKPILGRIDLRYVALEIEKCAQSRLSCPMPDGIGDEWGFQIYCHIIGLRPPFQSQKIAFLGATKHLYN